MPEDIVQKHGNIYAKTAPAVLGDQHSFLLTAIEKHMPKAKGKRLLVIGSSNWVLPYSSEPERISQMIGNGKIVLMDYNDNMVNGARKFLEKIEYDKKSGLKLNKKNRKKEIDVNELEAKTISFVRSNIREQLPFPDNSFDCIDATLVIHHATPYMENLDIIVKELHRVLAPGGLLHYGTGDVDMDSESKLVKIAMDVEEYFDRKIMIVDQRDEHNGYLTKCIVDDGKVKIANNCTSYDNMIFVSNKGRVIIPQGDNNGLMKFLWKKGYKNRISNNKSVSIPLIDPSIDSKFVDEIKNYYNEIYQRAVVNGCHSKDLTLLKQAIDFEQGNAIRGLTEYYRSFNKIQKALEKAGFMDVNRKMNSSRPFYNILAHKN